jgi:hypothetical protein
MRIPILSIPIALFFGGCSQEHPQCSAISDAANPKNELRLILNPHDKSYSAILICGSSNPVMVAKFNQCLTGPDGLAQANTFFEYCKGNVDLIPTLPGSNVAVLASTTKKPSISPQTTTASYPRPVPPAIVETETPPPTSTTTPTPLVVAEEGTTEEVRPAPPRRRPITH